MNIIKTQAAVLLLALLLLAGCQGKGPKGREIVAKVEGAYLTREVVLALIPENLNGEEREFFIKRIIDQWIDNQVLAQKARQEGLELSVTESWQIRNLETDMLAEKYLNTTVKINFMVTDQEIEDYYNSNLEQFKRNLDEARLVHVFFEQLDNTIAKEIRESKDLLEVIQKNYLDRQDNRIMEANGDLGYIPVEQLRKEFQQTIKNSKTGAIYGPIRTSDGYHYLQVLDRQPAGSFRDLNTVRDEVIVHLQAAKRFREIKIIKEQTRKEFAVETFYNNIL